MLDDIAHMTYRPDEHLDEFQLDRFFSLNMSEEEITLVRYHIGECEACSLLVIERANRGVLRSAPEFLIWTCETWLKGTKFDYRRA